MPVYLHYWNNLYVVFCVFMYSVSAACPDYETVQEIELCKESRGFGEAVILSFSNVSTVSQIRCSCEVKVYDTTSLLSQYYGPGYTGCGVQVQVGDLTYSCQDSLTRIDVPPRFDVVFRRETTLNVPEACLLFKSEPGSLISVQCNKPNNAGSTPVAASTLTPMSVTSSTTVLSLPSAEPTSVTSTPTTVRSSSSTLSIGTSHVPISTKTVHETTIPPASTTLSTLPATSPKSPTTINELTSSTSSTTISTPLTRSSTLEPTTPRIVTSKETTKPTILPPDSSPTTTSAYTTTSTEPRVSTVSTALFTDSTTIGITSVASTRSTMSKTTIYRTVATVGSSLSSVSKVPSSTTSSVSSTTTSQSSSSSTSDRNKLTTKINLPGTTPTLTVSTTTLSTTESFESQPPVAASRTQDEDDQLDIVIIASSVVGGLLLIAVIVAISVLIYRNRDCGIKQRLQPVMNHYTDAYGRGITTNVHSVHSTVLYQFQTPDLPKTVNGVQHDGGQTTAHVRSELASIRNADIERIRTYNTRNAFIYSSTPREGNVKHHDNNNKQIISPLTYQTIVFNNSQLNKLEHTHAVVYQPNQPGVNSNNCQPRNVHQRGNHSQNGDAYIVDKNGNVQTKQMNDSVANSEVYTIERRNNERLLVYSTNNNNTTTFKGYSMETRPGGTEGINNATKESINMQLSTNKPQNIDVFVPTIRNVDNSFGTITDERSKF